VNIIQVENLGKRYGDFDAVKQINFTVEKGEVFGFLGPNGAGKTTTINMLTGLAKPTSGAITISGQDGIKHIKKVQRIIGIVPDESNLYDDLSGYDNLVFCASLYGMPKELREKRAKELLKQFSLDDTGKRPFKAYSKGMKRKLTIAAGIIHEPEILFLDEPTTGIDVESARQIRKLIKELNGKGTTIFLTTHYIEDAERLCDRIGFIVGGKVIQIDTVKNLMRSSQKEHLMEFGLEQPGSEDLDTALRERFPEVTIKKSTDRSLRLASGEKLDLRLFMDFFTEQKVTLSEARIIRPSLEDVFVEITGIEIDKLKKEKEGHKK
jgi:ABC-2 type transport system ATP-binding protein